MTISVNEQQLIEQVQEWRERAREAEGKFTAVFALIEEWIPGAHEVNYLSRLRETLQALPGLCVRAAVGDALRGRLMFEDELPDTITDEEYAAWYARSSVIDGARVGPAL